MIVVTEEDNIHTKGVCAKMLNKKIPKPGFNKKIINYEKTFLFLKFLILVHELINATCRIYKLHFTRIKRV